MVPCLAEKWTTQLIIAMFYPQLQGQVGGVCEAAGLVEEGANREQTSCLPNMLLLCSRPRLLSCGNGVFLLPGLLSFEEKIQMCILSKSFQYLKFCKLLKILKNCGSWKQSKYMDQEAPVCNLWYTFPRVQILRNKWFSSGTWKWAHINIQPGFTYSMLKW